MMMDIAVVKESYDNGGLDDIGGIQMTKNNGDAFKKIGSKDDLESLLDTGPLEQNVSQCIARETGQDNATSKAIINIDDKEGSVFQYRIELIGKLTSQ